MTRFARFRDIFTRVSTYLQIFAAVTALTGLFGFKQRAEWQVIKDSSDGTTLPTNDPDKAPPSAVVYKGIPVSEEEQRKLAEKICGGMSVVFLILSAVFAQKEEAIPTNDNSPSSSTGSGFDRRVASLLVGGLLFLPVALTPSSGCARVEAGHRTEVVRAERTIDISATVVNEFLKAEQLTQPGGEITKFADDLRDTFPGLVREATLALRTYKYTGEGDPNPKVRQISALASLARRYLTEMAAKSSKPPG